MLECLKMHTVKNKDNFTPKLVAIDQPLILVQHFHYFKRFTVNRHSKRRPKLFFKANYRSMQVKSIADPAYIFDLH